tara:strand:+ start:662 stop:781 length:120 start_codon:yes stop_codon:yes gene_type:complete
MTVAWWYYSGQKGLACRLDGGRDFKGPLLPQSKSEPAEN